VLVLVLFLVWAGYHFNMEPLQAKGSADPRTDRVFAKWPALRGLAYKALELPLPLTQFAAGIHRVSVHNSEGHDAYLLGEYRRTGWWYFFPVVLAVKTPLGFLILVALGMAMMMRGFRKNSWQRNLTVIFPAAILLLCMNSRIDLGVRHILPIYPLLAVIAGHTVSELFNWARRRPRILLVLPVVLVISVMVDALKASPDYLAYFNQFAGEHPERFLAESDLDWGQDLGRLSRRLKELHADHVGIAYFGITPLDKAGLPPCTELSMNIPATHGYLAVSVRWLTLEYAREKAFAWLKDRPPLERVGKSIYLYDLGQ
jgi:hypothetical protein